MYIGLCIGGHRHMLPSLAHRLWRACLTTVHRCPSDARVATIAGEVPYRKGARLWSLHPSIYPSIYPSVHSSEDSHMSCQRFGTTNLTELTRSRRPRHRRAFFARILTHTHVSFLSEAVFMSPCGWLVCFWGTCLVSLQDLRNKAGHRASTKRRTQHPGAQCLFFVAG